jgi:hypothetical protein
LLLRSETKKTENIDQDALDKKKHQMAVGIHVFRYPYHSNNSALAQAHILVKFAAFGLSQKKT